MYTYAIKKHNVSDLHTISKAIMHSPPPAVLESHACQFPCGFRTVAPWRRPAVVVTLNRQMPMRGALTTPLLWQGAALMARSRITGAQLEKHRKCTERSQTTGALSSIVNALKGHELQVHEHHRKDVALQLPCCGWLRCTKSMLATTKRL